MYFDVHVQGAPELVGYEGQGCRLGQCGQRGTGGEGEEEKEEEEGARGGEKVVKRRGMDRI